MVKILVRFFKGFKIGMVSGILLSIFVYGIFFYQINQGFNILANVFINPFALNLYKILMILSPILIVFMLIKKFNHKEKLDVGIMTGTSWSFTLIQIVMFLVNQPSIVNDFFKGGNFTLF